MKTTRADWAAVAASVDFSNIRNLPSDSPFGAPDISQVGGRSFNNGQVATWNSSLRRFVPATPSSGGTTPPAPALVTQWRMITVSWDAPSLLPLQSCYEDFDFIGALTSDPVVAGPPYDLEFCQITCQIIVPNYVRVYVFNGNLTPVDLSSGIWKIARFPTV